MKRIFLLLICFMTLALSNSIAEETYELSNASILKEYKSLLIGEWELLEGVHGDFHGNLNREYIFTEDNIDSECYLFISGSNEVYILPRTMDHFFHDLVYILTFSSDGQCMMLYREGVGGTAYRKR